MSKFLCTVLDNGTIAGGKGTTGKENGSAVGKASTLVGKKSAAGKDGATVEDTIVDFEKESALADGSSTDCPDGSGDVEEDSKAEDAKAEDAKGEDPRID
jgi:hypothetical protein